MAVGRVLLTNSAILGLALRFPSSLLDQFVDQTNALRHELSHNSLSATHRGLWCQQDDLAVLQASEQDIALF